MISKRLVPRLLGWSVPAGRRSTILEVVADALTVAGVFLSPLRLLQLGSSPMAFAAMILVILIRGVQFCGPGLDFGEIRKHSFLLSLTGVMMLAGFTTGIVVNEPFDGTFILVTYGTLGMVAVVATYVREATDVTRLLKAYALGCAVLSVSAFLMGSTDSTGRLVGLTTHYNLLGHDLILGIPICIYLWELAKERRERQLWVFCAVAQGAALMASGSRGGLLGVAVALLIYGVLSRNRRYAVTVLAAAYLGVAALAAGVVELPANSPIARITNADASTSGSNAEREKVLDEALETVREKPVFGDGYKFTIVTHTVYLQAWIGAGAIGAFVVFFLGACFLVWPLAQRRSTLALACAGSGIAVAWGFTNVLGLPEQWVILALMVRATDSPLRLIKDRQRAEPDLIRHPTELAPS